MITQEDSKKEILTLLQGLKEWRKQNSDNRAFVIFIADADTEIMGCSETGSSEGLMAIYKVALDNKFLVLHRAIAKHRGGILRWVKCMWNSIIG